MIQYLLEKVTIYQLIKENMMHKLITLLLIFSSLVSQAQIHSIGVGIGYGSTTMEDLKAINENVSNNITFEHGTTRSFPAWLTFSAQFRLMLGKRLSTGMNYYYNSSGSRISAKDYSGEYHFDQIIVGHSIGTGLYFRMNPLAKLALVLGLEGGGTYSELRIEEEIIIVDSGSSKNVNHLFATGIYVLPVIEISYPVGPVVFGTKVGYNFSFLGKLRYDGEEVTRPDGKSKIRSDWSGYRILLSLNLPLKKNQKKED